MPDPVYRSLRVEDREECIALWTKVFNGEIFRKYLFGDVEWQPEYTQVAEVDGRLVSAVHIVKRTVSCGDFRLTMGGVANVATLPDYRGRGYNTELLRRAIQVMEADAMDFSALGTGIHAYYERLGFDRLSLPHMRARAGRALPPSSGRYTVRQAVADDAEDIRALYAEYNAGRPITVQRGDSYWREWIGIGNPKALDELRVAEDEAGRVCGYVRAHMDPEKPMQAPVLYVGELCAQRNEQTTQCFIEMLLPLAVALGRHGGIEIRLDLPADPQVLEAVRQVWSEPTARAHGHYMARLLQREGLLQALLLEAAPRWRAAGSPEAELRFATPYGAVNLVASSGRLLAEADDRPADLPQSGLFSLLFGVETPRALGLSGSAAEVAACLMPPLAPIYYGWDGF